MSGTKVTAYETARPSTTQESVVIEDDYVITVDGSAWVSAVSVYPNGTHVITVKRPDQKRPGTPVQHVTYDPPERP